MDIQEQINKLQAELNSLQAKMFRNSFSASSSKNKAVHFNKSISFKEQTAPPFGDPASNIEARVYLKEDKLIIQFKEGTTVRYKYMLLSGT